MRKGRYTLITGASRGIGHALAVEFARHGSNLVLVARGLDRLEVLAIELANAWGVDVQVCAADLSDPTEPQRVIEFCRLRGLNIHTLVNNAGVLAAGELADASASEMRELVQINICAAVELTLAFLPAMREHQSGSIVNISSVAGICGIGGASLYAASKAFMTRFSDTLATELEGTAVTCHTVLLGPVQTDMLTKSTWLHSLAMQPSSVAQVIHDGVLARRRKFSAGVLGTALRVAATVLPDRLVGRVIGLH